MSTKHTPGPWRISDKDDDFAHCATEHYHQISAGKGYYAGEPHTGFGLQGFLSTGDARLIAAAPIMYSLLEKRAECGDDEAKAILEEIDNG